MKESELRELAAVTALNDMMAKGWFSICTIDNVGKLLNRNPAGDARTCRSLRPCIERSRSTARMDSGTSRLSPFFVSRSVTHRAPRSTSAGIRPSSSPARMPVSSASSNATAASCCTVSTAPV